MKVALIDVGDEAVSDVSEGVLASEDDDLDHPYINYTEEEINEAFENPDHDRDEFDGEPNEDDDDFAMTMQKRMDILTGSRYSRTPKQNIQYVMKNINNFRYEDDDNHYFSHDNNDENGGDYFYDDDGIDDDEKPDMQFRLSNILTEIACDETFNEIKEKLEGTGRFTKSANKK